MRNDDCVKNARTARKTKNVSRRVLETNFDRKRARKTLKNVEKCQLEKKDQKIYFRRTNVEQKNLKHKVYQKKKKCRRVKDSS